MHWNLYDLPPEIMNDGRGNEADDINEPDSPELEAAHDFPTLTDCPMCGHRDAEQCGCFD